MADVNIKINGRDYTVPYGTTVLEACKQAGIEMEKSELHSKAMTWEIRHSGRTPRVARQFIASLRA